MNNPLTAQDSPIKILLVDDETDILTFMQYYLTREGYRVFTATNGREAISTALLETPDLIILDLMMPEMNGFEAYKIMRQHNALDSTSIVFLTARGEDFLQIQALDMGADDYIAKPIKPTVLGSKIKSLLRRRQPPIVEPNTTAKTESAETNHEILRVADLEIDRETFLLKKNGQIIELPRKEFNLIYLLASKPGKVFSREDILAKIWGNDVIVTERTIDVHVRKLREKLGEGYIKTIKGVGYKFIVGD